MAHRILSFADEGRDRLDRSSACAQAITVAFGHLASAVEQAKLLPNDCASTLIRHAGKLTNTFEQHPIWAVSIAGV